MDISNIKIHVFEPEESVNKESWYKDPSTFSYSQCFDNIENIQIGHIIEDDMGTRFRILSIHHKWQKIDMNSYKPIIEFTVERYIRHGKQNPYMI